MRVIGYLTSTVGLSSQNFASGVYEISCIYSRATSGTSLHIYPSSASPTMTTSTNMYALHEHGESHDENSENESKSGRLDNIATPDELQEEADNNGANGQTDNGDLNPSSMAASVNFNMEGLKDMLKCANCHRFLFPPILQCLNGHMECRMCFDLKPQCGKCHQKMVDVPAKFAEMITEQFNVQCSYAEKGCTESVAYKVGCVPLMRKARSKAAHTHISLMKADRRWRKVAKAFYIFNFSSCCCYCRIEETMRRFVPLSQSNVLNSTVPRLAP